eukprot:182110_1
MLVCHLKNLHLILSSTMSLSHPLLEDNHYVEMEQVSNTNESVEKILDQLLENDISIKNNKGKELINILGGIENILKYYVSNNINNDILSVDQLTEINDILLSSLNDEYHSKEANDNDGDDNLLILHQSDTLFHHVFHRILFYNQFMIIFMQFIFISYIIIGLIRIVDKEWFEWYFIWIPLSIMICLVLILLLLSVNKTLFQKTRYSFDFMIKILYAIRAMVLIVIFYDISVIDIVINTIDTINVLVVVICFALVDGLAWSRKHKSFILIGNTMLFCSLTISWRSHESRTISLFGYISLDITELVSGSFEVIAIFMFKQTVRILYNYKNDYATSLKNPVHIKWIN